MKTLVLAFAAASLLSVNAQNTAMMPKTPSESMPKTHASVIADPLAVHHAAIVIDTHADTTQRFLDESWNFGDPLKGGSLNLESARTGNLGAQFFSIWVDPEAFKGQYAHRTLALMDAVYQQTAKYPEQMRMAYSADDIVAAHRQHKLAALMGVEGGHSIEDNLGLLRDYYRLGARYMTLTWANSTDWADSSGDYTDAKIPHTKEGLTEFGKDVVYEMNRLGMMVDISHVADKTFYRTLVISRAPVIASHSSARALCDSPRNMTDEMLRAVAVNDGVVMVNFYSAFLSQDFRNAMQAQAPEREKAINALKEKYKAEGKPIDTQALDALNKEYAARIPRPPFHILIDHIDHIAKVAGVDHVGLGSDFDGVDSLPEGLDSAADLPKITHSLMARGYTAADCDKMLGGNLLRVFRQVEAVSHQLQSEQRPRIGEHQPGEKK
ncbi:MAG TPA: dipeptidase [Acidisarcina sp.]|nr:dipeptidase [Acidisarcina sp.]